jgi:hypothetical protein
MSKSKNKQRKLKDFMNTSPRDNLNQNHDSKQVPLGPNTKRKPK